MLTFVSSAIILALKSRLETDQVSPLIYSLPLLLAVQLIDAYLITSEVYSSILATILSGLLTPLITVVFILFGAPATDYLAQTALCSAAVTLLCIQPMVARYGMEYSFWKRAFALDLPLTDVYGGFIGGVFGAWLGAVPIALDWDRPWQQWPITILLGSAVGAAIGSLAGAIRSSGKSDKYEIEKQTKIDKKERKEIDKKLKTANSSASTTGASASRASKRS